MVKVVKKWRKSGQTWYEVKAGETHTVIMGMKNLLKFMEEYK